MSFSFLITTSSMPMVNSHSLLDSPTPYRLDLAVDKGRSWSFLVPDTDLLPTLCGPAHNHPSDTSICKNMTKNGSHVVNVFYSKLMTAVLVCSDNRHSVRCSFSHCPAPCRDATGSPPDLETKDRVSNCVSRAEPSGGIPFRKTANKPNLGRRGRLLAKEDGGPKPSAKANLARKV